MHRFIGAFMPALGSNAEALSTLQPRAISNLGGRSAIATTSYDVRTSIENCRSMGVLLADFRERWRRILTIQEQDRNPRGPQSRPGRGELVYRSSLSSFGAPALHVG